MSRLLAKTILAATISILVAGLTGCAPFPYDQHLDYGPTIRILETQKQKCGHKGRTIVEDCIRKQRNGTGYINQDGHRINPRSFRLAYADALKKYKDEGNSVYYTNAHNLGIFRTEMSSVESCAKREIRKCENQERQAKLAQERQAKLAIEQCRNQGNTPILDNGIMTECISPEEVERRAEAERKEREAEAEAEMKAQLRQETQDAYKSILETTSRYCTNSHDIIKACIADNTSQETLKMDQTYKILTGPEIWQCLDSKITLFECEPQPQPPNCAITDLDCLQELEEAERKQADIEAAEREEAERQRRQAEGRQREAERKRKADEERRRTNELIDKNFKEFLECMEKKDPIIGFCS
ncbi:MAG: hypothetical protein OXF73_01860 [Gammaproteobacteria bacterium]|nr:hypothetical protein [Gammaproteobacteria bacterium]